MSKMPFMPIAVTDWMADTAALTLQEKGALFELSCHLWLAGGWLADNDERLALRLRMTPDRWLRLRVKLEQHLRIEGESLTIPSVLANYLKAQRRSEVNKANAVKGASKRPNNW